MKKALTTWWDDGWQAVITPSWTQLSSLVAWDEHWWQQIHNRHTPGTTEQQHCPKRCRVVECTVWSVLVRHSMNGRMVKCCCNETVIVRHYHHALLLTPTQCRPSLGSRSRPPDHHTAFVYNWVFVVSAVHVASEAELQLPLFGLSYLQMRKKRGLIRKDMFKMRIPE